MKQRDESGLVKEGRPSVGRNPRLDEAEMKQEQAEVWVLGSNESELGPTVLAKPFEGGASRDDSPTVVYIPLGKGSAETDAMSNPPAGWLVIVDGPRKGHTVELGYGLNWIGRDRTERVTLDYGDTAISRFRHIAVAYDALSRRFHIQHGGAVNLSYVNNQPLLAPVELEPFACIRIGNTTLRFVPLCGPDFSWEDQVAED